MAGRKLSVVSKMTLVTGNGPVPPGIPVPLDKAEAEDLIRRGLCQAVAKPAAKPAPSDTGGSGDGGSGAAGDGGAKAAAIPPLKRGRKGKLTA
ncbi:MAG: hypothetical protein AAFX62_17730, partial [Pseudomonadota bacterium]